MKYADLFHLKLVQVALLLVALAGAFLLGRCSGPEPIKETVQVNQPPFEQSEEKKELDVIENIKKIEISPPGSASVTPPVASVSESAGLKAYEFTEQCREKKADTRCWCYQFPKPVHLVKPESGSAEKKLDYVAPPERLPDETAKSKEPPPEVFLGYDASVCAGDLVPAVQAAVANLDAQSILYGVGPLSDCSGIFHQVLMGVKKRCPDHAYPSLEQYRDSRELARWYHEQGELILIKDVLERTDLIRPGMVLFYGRSGSVYSNFTVNDLVSSRAGIDHVGVVVSVARGKDGEVASYKLFHGYGRKGKTAASVTNWHKRIPTRASYPPFGNGRQQLVAAARIVRPEVTGVTGGTERTGAYEMLDK